MEAAQTYRHFKVHVQPLSSMYEQLQIMEEVQDSSRSETHQEDDKHQWAGLDVHLPVEVWLVELTDDSDEAQNRDHQRQQEAEDV